MKVLGYEHVKFSFQDGKEVAGYYIYLQDEAPTGNIVGMKTERVFLSDNKVADCGFKPHLNDVVKVFYNKYGKVDSILVTKAAS